MPRTITITTERIRRVIVRRAVVNTSPPDRRYSKGDPTPTEKDSTEEKDNT